MDFTFHCRNYCSCFLRFCTACYCRLFHPIIKRKIQIVYSMDRDDIEEMAKDLIPLAEEKNAGEALMTADYDEKWEFIMGFRKKKKYRT